MTGITQVNLIHQEASCLLFCFQLAGASGGTVTDAAIKYCSNNALVASVDFDGTITAVQPGSAIITVCVGSVKKEINVTVN